MTKKKPKIRRILMVILCVFLVLYPNFTEPMKLLAEDKVTYVSDLKLYAVDPVLHQTVDDAAAMAKKDGFTLVRKDLNNGSAILTRNVYLGYKTTEDPAEAITDIRTLAMDRDYYLYNYNELREYIKSANESTANTMYRASQVFAENYRAGSPKAIDAYAGLNLFCVDNNNTKFGDYILQGKADQDLFLDIAIKASSGTVNAVLSFLNSGIAPYEPSKPETDNWASKIKDSELKDKLEGNLKESERVAIVKKYDDAAQDLFAQIQDFTTRFENASARKNYDITGTIDTTIANENGQDMEDAEDAVEALDSIPEEDGDALFLATYENLNQYFYDDDTKLGDWLVEMGHYTVDAVDREALYPLVDAMGEVQTGLARTLGFVSATANLGENVRNEDLWDIIPKIKNAIYDYNGDDCISLWDNADDDIENSYIAYTSDAIRKGVSNDSVGKKSFFDVFSEKYDTVMKWVNIGLGVLVVGTYVLKGTLTLAAAAVTYFSGTAAAVSLSAMFSSMAAGLAVAGVFLMYIGLAILAMSIIWAIGTWLWGEVKKVIPSIEHTHIPSYVFEAADTPDGPVTVKYKTVRNHEGKLGDVNDFDQSKWQILCYTKDTMVGSPLTMDSEGNIFVVNYGNSAGMLGYDCINFFGERSPADMNAYTSKNSVNGIYVSYRTVRSLRSEGPFAPEEGQPETNPSSGVSYLADIIVAVAKSGDAARAKILSKEGKYYMLDYELSKEHDNFTYIGYALTTDPNQAITDIRIAPYHGTDSITFGDVTYTYASHLGLAKSDGDNSITPTDALFKTKDPKAGSPIIADGLHVVTKHSDAEPGWEPVTLFCGLPYNFASGLDTFESPYENDDVMLSGYSTDDSDDWGRTNVYLYYEPTEKYTEGVQYLSGMFCINGYKIEKTISQVWAQTTANMGQLKKQILSYPNAAFMDTNLAQTVQVDLDSGHGRLEQYLGYTWSYNPKRAICDITAFQGDSVMNTLPYTITKPAGGVTTGYAAVSTICQQNVDYSIHSYVTRFISPNNAIINDKALLVSYTDYKEGLMDGYTKTLPKGFACTWEKTNFLPLGLYVCGPVSGKAPLSLRDIVISSLPYNGTVEESQIAYYITGGALTGSAPDGRYYNGDEAFHSIYELKNPYETEPLNIAYPQWYNKGNSAKSTTPLYIYLKGAIPSKPRYITSVSIGSYSREQYKSDILQQKTNVSDDEIKQIDSSVNLTAMLGAVSSCSDETLCVNLAAGPGDAWYQRGGGKASGSAAGNVPAAYLGVSRTDKASKAITAILLYQNDARSTSAMIKIDGAEYYCDSTKSPIIVNGKRYFLYYTRNRGVLTGSRVQDIVINEEMLSQGMTTALCGKAGSTATYGEPTFPNFIHMKFDLAESVYYTQLYIGKGATQKEALSDFISRECFQYINLDLNAGAQGSTLYLGYSAGYIDMNNASQTKIRMAWSEAVWDIIVTDGLPYQPDGFVSTQNGIYYAPVSDVDLNDGANSPAHPLYMYYCSPVVSEEYNDDHGAATVMPDEVFSAPISKMAFARYDRVPYSSSLPGTDETGGTLSPWEYVMLSDHSARADFNAGAFGFDSDGYPEDNRISMFLQRYDGSIKPCGQITGGFLDEYMDFGTASLN